MAIEITTVAEGSAQGTAMVSWLHQSLVNALGECATLRGHIAVLEHRLAVAAVAAPSETPESNAP